jgi:hypothetical protein
VTSTSPVPTLARSTAVSSAYVSVNACGAVPGAVMSGGAENDTVGADLSGVICASNVPKSAAAALLLPSVSRAAPATSVSP